MRRDMALVQRAHDGAAAGGRGAAGLGDVLGALGEGRIDRLVIARDRPIAGFAGRDGELVPPDARPPGLAEAELTPEPLFADRLALRALETGARVTVVTGEAAEALADADGVAALLRW
jgi:peptide subunit release factor 1 (eRF1)